MGTMKGRLTLMLAVGVALWAEHPAGAQGLATAMKPASRPQPETRVSYALDIRDEDDDNPHWAEYATYPTEGQAITAARALKAGGYRTRIRTAKERLKSPETYVLWVRDPEAPVPSWKDGGHFDTRGEAVAAEQAAHQTGLDTSLGDSRDGRTTLPPIETAQGKKLALLYQVQVAQYNNLNDVEWVVAFETFDPGAAQEAAIRIRSNQDPLPPAMYGPGHEYHPQTPVRVASKEVLVDEATYRKSFPTYPPK